MRLARPDSEDCRRGPTDSAMNHEGHEATNGSFNERAFVPS
jgi:hypothetical protein